MNNTWTVYMHISPSNKRYIGITSKSVNERWKNGFGYKTQMFYRVVQKYGWDNIQHIIIAENLSEQAAKDMEILLIKQYKTNDPNYGYNLTIGGDGTNGYKMSDETKRKLSEIHTGRKHSVETKILLSQKLKGRNPVPICDDEFRQKMSKAKTGQMHSFETRRKMSLSQRKRTMSEESKRKISESRIGKKHWQYGKKLPDAWRQKISSGCKGRGTKPIVQSTLSGEIVQEFDSLTDAATYINPNHLASALSNISECCHNKKSQYKNYLWRFKENNNG